jgi:hypothetical protein
MHMEEDMLQNLNDFYVRISQEIVDYLGLNPEKDFNFIYSLVASFLAIVINISMRKHG